MLVWEIHIPVSNDSRRLTFGESSRLSTTGQRWKLVPAIPMIWFNVGFRFWIFDPCVEVFSAFPLTCSGELRFLRANSSLDTKL
jgi:hypothetical protein